MKRTGHLDSRELPGMKDARALLSAEKRKPADRDRPARRAVVPEQIEGQLDLLADSERA